MQIILDHVSFTYSKRRKNRPLAGPLVLGKLQLTVDKGEMLAVAGKSGSGKSTFLQLLKGFLSPSEGNLYLDRTDPHLNRQPEQFDRIGFIFQYPEHQLFSTTVYEDIAFGLRSAKLSPEIQEAKVRKAMQAVQLDYGKFKDRSPFELSGGEKRRVAIAGVVVLEPEVLILDEPTAGLDLQSRTALFDLLHAMNREQAITIIWVSHQLEEILEHAARMIALKAGQFVADGAPSVLLSDPALLQAFDWEEPPALAVSRILRELGAAVQDNRPLTALEAAGAILALHQNRQVSI